jgi:hypothetical protein
MRGEPLFLQPGNHHVFIIGQVPTMFSNFPLPDSLDIDQEILVEPVGYWSRKLLLQQRLEALVFV